MSDKSKKVGALSARTWTSILLFGLIGQIAWVVENMYFSRFMQNEITKAPYATTLLVAFSAIFATLATLIGGALSDRTGKRKVFICWGYVVWGFTIAAFSLVPMQPSADKVLPMVILVVAMDCIMSVIGSISNDASYNTWITDVTNTANRARVDTILAVIPLFAMAIVFGGFDSMTNSSATVESWQKFFIIMGIMPTVGGVIGLFLMKDKEGIKPNKSNSFFNDFTYSLKPSTIKQNKMLYVCLSGYMIASIGYQVYINYLFNIVEGTLKIKNYIIPVGIIMVLAAVGSVIIGVAMDKKGKQNFYYPTIIAGVIGCIIIWSAKFFVDKNETAEIIILIIGGTLTIGVNLVMAGLFTASYRDFIPDGKEGLFQGCRIVMYVLVPMIIGPVVAQVIINMANRGVASEDIVYPMELFLGCAVVLLFCFIPSRIVRVEGAKHHEELMKELQNDIKD
ncbi:MFS transporter [Eubacterium coprostanoligenes]|uniref:MFS transporter n=1 Tax=Eubacterium coprostanoligenes TaxID=290054 RepID=UPI002A82348C|nr:MFS transporter [Eubacterium coprostanoligenes]MDY4698270.1 MFS transporter [Eubacterium coprostanoligenes]